MEPDGTDRKVLQGCKRIFICIVSVFLLIIGFVIYNTFYNLNSVPKGKLIRSIESPNKNYIINTYHNDSGALGDDGVRGELYETKRQKRKNIYFNYPELDPYVEWLNNSEVVIGNQQLNILKGETYDWRRDPDWKREIPKQFRDGQNPSRRQRMAEPSLGSDIPDNIF